MAATPGPWTVSLDYDQEGFPTGYARVVTPNHADPEEGWVSDYFIDADARLIAAAPELLEAAKGLLESIAGEVRDPLNIDIEQTPEDDPLLEMRWIKALAQAIAKAESQ